MHTQVAGTQRRDAAPGSLSPLVSELVSHTVRNVQVSVSAGTGRRAGPVLELGPEAAADGEGWRRSQGRKF